MRMVRLMFRGESYKFDIEMGGEKGDLRLISTVCRFSPFRIN